MQSSLRSLAHGATYPITQHLYTDPQDGSLLDVVHDLSAWHGRGEELRRLFDARLASWGPLDRSGVWRYRELVLPHVAPQHIVTRGEGNTNLYPANADLQRYTGLAALQLKHEGENPTGSFKDRGMTTGVTRAREIGATAVICASTGNTSASMTSFARMAGVQPLILFPYGKVAVGKVSQSLAYGAVSIQVRGDFDAALALVRDAAERLPVYLLNSVNPFRLEGQKSIIIEMLHQRGWRVPDWIVVPGGNLGNTSAFGKALLELREVGLIERLPRVAVIQAEGASPFAAAFRREFDHLEPMSAETVATAIRIGNPANYAKAVRTVLETEGWVTTVTDQEIMDAKAQVDLAGIGCEPASGASVAGARKLVAEGVISPAAEVVCVLTGHVLKDPQAVIDYHSAQMPAITPQFTNPMHTIEGHLEELMAFLPGATVSA
ncbi:MAG: threonine synthase [Anaerolineae bacterium]|nr:threonine synthase [Anaerolineae bacterium]